MRQLITAAVALVVAATMLCASGASATSTIPKKVMTYDLPWSYLYYGADGQIIINTTAPRDWKARAQFNRSLDSLGWDYLNVEGDGDYFSGYLEAFLTADRIELQGVPATPTGDVYQWLIDHLAHMRDLSEALSATDDFWRVIGSQLAFIDGLTAGLNAASGKNYTTVQVFLISFGEELGDVQTAVKVQKAPPSEAGFRQNWRPTHCSALIKVTADDLYMAHDTWDVFTGMAYRMYKVYNFHGNTVAMSSHPAFLASADDWYVTDTQLAIQETTNGVMNLTLYHAVVPKTVSEFLRVMAATFLAKDGATWTTLFARENSGTYNNQYMVVDFKLFSPGSTVIDNTLWVAEQLPGIVVRGDVSSVLREQGYWASYNIPYFPEIYQLSGYAKDFAIYGNFYSYSKYARPEIFRRNQSGISAVADMMRMMRYNDWQVDPLSRIQNCTGAPNDQCLAPQSSMLSIASRGDLMPLYSSPAEMTAHYGPLSSFMAQGCFGAIDSKIAAWSSRHTLKAWVISGPSNDQQPTFQWDTKSCTGSPAPKGTPAVVDYPWVEFNIRRDPLA